MTERRWKKLSSKTLLDHPRLQVVEDVVELPNGHRTQYLRFPLKGAAATVIAIRDGKVCLEKEYSYPPNAVLYQFPGGFIEEGEDVEKGANRELMEEVGLSAKTWHSLGWMYANNRRSDMKMHVLVARELSDAQLPPDDEEQIQLFWFTEKEIDDLIASGSITNAFVLAAWQLYTIKAKTT